ncbi:MAG TPA: ABC transporter ATP-binding protein [Tepidanaerobacteraceae bacterium]|nr:ABC transporter ATP-binding protein [Tepidanaerobacteraceae bacterium]HQE05797.1 ABC transporter ATP-binding protein [Tepidanaerobacteraceae bacterium]
MSPTVAINMEKLTKIFYTNQKKVVALDNIDLSVKEGEFLCIVGPSGCGKTTLLRILAGLEKQTWGKLVIRSKNPEKPLTSMVFQGDSVFPWMTVKENVAYSLRIKGLPKSERLRIAGRYIKLMGLEGFADAFPHQLSGGMKQRINVARAFVSDPEILLMDEPFGALDEQNRLLLQQELLKIWKGSGKTSLFITHSIDEALVLADRIMVMTAHPGKVKAIVPVNIPRPRDILSLRSSPNFGALFKQIWELLQEEVLKAKSMELKT